jgi:GAF domain-containing protein
MCAPDLAEGLTVIFQETQSSEQLFEQESARLAALYATGILDTAPDPAYDAITRLAAEHFHADTALIGFADETRYWVKSHWGEVLREIPKEGSLFELVLAHDAACQIQDLQKWACSNGHCQQVPRDFRFAASVPVRSQERHVLGSLTILCRDSKAGLSPAELRTLESMAEMVSAQVELQRLRRMFSRLQARRVAQQRRSAPRPRSPRIRALLPARG